MRVLAVFLAPQSAKDPDHDPRQLFQTDNSPPEPIEVSACRLSLIVEGVDDCLELLDPALERLDRGGGHSGSLPDSSARIR
jgi:hypothetical protein